MKIPSEKQININIPLLFKYICRKGLYMWGLISGGGAVTGIFSILFAIRWEALGEVESGGALMWDFMVQWYSLSFWHPDWSSHRDSK